jgi:hypothetical protein
MKQPPKPKYRPALTEDALKELYASCPAGETKEYLKQYLIKIGVGITGASYFLTSPAKPTVEDSLGFTSDSDVSQIEFKSYASQNPAELYQKWLQDPLTITASELETVQTYRYENDMMDDAEEAAYFNKLMG